LDLRPKVSIGAFGAFVVLLMASLPHDACAQALATVRYVNASNAAPVSPYTNWATAATSIQDAINAAAPGDQVLVTNGVYQAGDVTLANGYAPNRIAATKPISVVSVNGPAVTVILGPNATGFQYSGYGRRCAYLTNGALLAGFTLSAGRVDFHDTRTDDQMGGGVLCTSVSAVVSNCVIAGNFAGRFGGGAFSGTLINCVITDNQAINLFIGGLGQGGGAYASDLRNCVITTNRANPQGGGACFGSLTNCLVAYNSAKFGGGACAAAVVNCTVVQNGAYDDGLAGPAGGGGVSGGYTLNSVVVQNIGPSGLTNFASPAMSYCCTVPDPGGEGNITNDPAFKDFASGNYRLGSNSPCINAGTNLPPDLSVDLDGRPRVVDAVVDMGAYEYQHLPFIIVPPVSQSVLIYSNVAFAVLASGDDPLGYQWQKDGVNLADGARVSGASTPSLVISNLLVPDTGGYQVVVTNASGTVTSAVATLSLLGLPSISVQPVSRTVPAATNVSFGVVASGLTALSYQWRLGQTALTAMTNSSLSLTNVQALNAGDYDVIITNFYGTITSAVATLTVLPTAPVIITQAVSRVVSVGQNISFTVAAKGSEPMSCRWQLNGADLPGATSFTLALSNANASFTGTYRAAVSNAAGFAFSTNVTLVISPVLIWGEINNPQLLLNIVIPATATNVIALAAGWCLDAPGLPCMALRADGTIATWGYPSREPGPPTNAVDLVAISIGGATTTANNLVLRADGTVVNWTGSTKPPLPPALTNGSLVAVAAGASHQLALRDDGTVIAWGSNTSGQTNVPPSATNVIAIAAGASHSLALRADGTVVGWGLNTSGQATALSNVANVIAIAAGGNQSLALLADGSVVGWIVTNTPTVTVSYGPLVGNATNKIAITAGRYHTLALGVNRTINGWGATEFGQITPPASATNAVAIAAGQDDSLALVRDPFAPPIPPRIARPPLGRAVMAGQSAVFNALAVGALPLSWQWYHNGAPVPGQTRTSLALTNVLPGDAGNYQLVAMNEFGSATSAVATVTVTIPQPHLSSSAVPGTGFRFNFASLPGVLYVTQYRDNLSAGAWTQLERRLGIGGLETVTDTSAGGAMRFYRVRALYAPSPAMTSATWTGNAVSFVFPTVDGAIYVVQYKTNLTDSVWLELSRQTGTGAPIVMSDPSTPGPSRFYRVSVE
jgi:hypothetical protein